MAKLNLNNIASGFSSTTQLNANFDLIEVALENTLSRDGSIPNSMSADLDLNGYNLINVGSLDVSSVTNSGIDLAQMVVDAEAYADEAANWAHYPAATLVPEGNMVDEYSAYSYAQDSLAYSLASASSATDSASSASSALTSELACAAYSNLGLGAAALYDFGLISDAILVFPTDLGLLV
jgi:hypothetical protein